jgi:hypothetical protein
MAALLPASRRHPKNTKTPRERGFFFALFPLPSLPPS